MLRCQVHFYERLMAAVGIGVSRLAGPGLGTRPEHLIQEQLQSTFVTPHDAVEFTVTHFPFVDFFTPQSNSKTTPAASLYFRTSTPPS